MHTLQYTVQCSLYSIHTVHKAILQYMMQISDIIIPGIMYPGDIYSIVMSHFLLPQNISLYTVSKKNRQKRAISMRINCLA